MIHVDRPGWGWYQRYLYRKWYPYLITIWLCFAVLDLLAHSFTIYCSLQFSCRSWIALQCRVWIIKRSTLIRRNSQPAYKAHKGSHFVSWYCRLYSWLFLLLQFRLLCSYYPFFWFVKDFRHLDKRCNVIDVTRYACSF